MSFLFPDASQTSGEEQDSFGQIGNFNATLEDTTGALTSSVEGESFNFGGGDNLRLMDDEEKKFCLPENDIEITNLTTSEHSVSYNLHSCC